MGILSSTLINQNLKIVEYFSSVLLIHCLLGNIPTETLQNYFFYPFFSNIIAGELFSCITTALKTKHFSSWLQS